MDQPTLTAGLSLKMYPVQVYLVVCNVFQLIAETLGLMCAIGTKTSTTAIIVASCVLLVLLSFNGFLVLTIPSYFK